MTPRMLPSSLPEAVRNDPKRSAEVQVYDRLKGDPLLAGFTIMYSCEWIGEYDGLLRDGEADFVIAHPDIGYISIEVKGGVVRRRIADGKWTSEDREGEIHHIENPVAQAKKSKKILLQALLERWSGRPPFIWARHGVILPHSYRPPSGFPMGAGLPMEIFAFKEDMPKLGARIVNMIVWSRDGATEQPGGLGIKGVKLLEDFYGRDLDFSPRLVSIIEETEQIIVNLTATQCRYLDFMVGARIALIEGGAGTGKTTLAAERARRAAAHGRSVVLLCFNRPLAVHLSAELTGTTASVATFHEFCSRVCAAAGIDLDAIRASSDQQIFWRERLPDLLAEVGLAGAPEIYDDIIVDEGQDFRGSWLDALRLFLRSGGSFFVFRDDFQNLYGGADAAEALGVIPMTLVENVRNTQKIFTAGSRFRSGSVQRCLGPEGHDVRWVRCEGNTTVRTVERELNRLIGVEGMAPEDIAVLTGRAVEISGLIAAETVGRHRWTRADEPVRGAFVLDSVMRFKGLDRPVVLLCDIEDPTTERAYVGLTRAKSHLIVIGSDQALDRLGRPQVA